MRIGLAQINTCIGDLEGNVERCLAAVEAAGKQGADLVVLPEMAVPGYPPRDILFDSSFTGAVYEANLDLAYATRDGPPVLVGTLYPSGEKRPGHPGLYNAAVLLNQGKLQLVAAKRLLPGYDVFFEPRWFMPGPKLPPVTIKDRKIGVLVCEDLWDEGYPEHPPAELLAQGAEILITLSASPYRRGIMDQRIHHARRHKCPLFYVNLCGANDELIFDGRSFGLNQEGEIIAQLPGFKEEVQVVDIATAPPVEIPELNPEEEVYQALVLGIRDFAGKNGLKHAVLGLSGGVDSAIVAVIAAEALGPKNVTAIAIPSRYSDPRSTSCAEELAQSLGIGFEVVALEGLHHATEETLGDLLKHGTAGENIQARLRALILMSFVNRYGGMLLNTSNKTELTVGYSTLYGDMAGSLCPIADLTKPEVYALARWIQETQDGVIPDFILDRLPSAELKPDQVDPFDYPKISPVLEKLVRENRSNAALRRSEHKRWHMGVILKVSEKAFGTGRMIPITRR